MTESHAQYDQRIGNGDNTVFVHIAEDVFFRTALIVNIPAVAGINNDGIAVGQSSEGCDFIEQHGRLYVVNEFIFTEVMNGEYEFVGAVLLGIIAEVDFRTVALSAFDSYISMSRNGFDEVHLACALLTG